MRVETRTGEYDVHIERGALRKLVTLVRAVIGDRGIFLISDSGAWNHVRDDLIPGLEKWRGHLILLHPGERHKRLDNVEMICTELHAFGADRTSVLVTIGGGVTGDVGGFAAACYMRGIDFVQVPTTLLAQVDASVGGKTGVNLESGKNLVGAFHQPRLVVVDPRTLATLPKREYRAGLQEVVKHGVIRSLGLFEFMESQANAVLAQEPAAVERMIVDSVRIKSEVVGADERETGLRRILNFGHTLGHALEAETGYQELLHGEAVGFGMLAATRLSELLGRAGPLDCRRIERTILSYLPKLRGRLRSVRANNIVDRIGGDKKAVGGRARFVLIEGIGRTVEVVAPPKSAVLAATGHALKLVRKSSRRSAA